MIVVSDTSSISALIHLRRADILETLYGSVLIPPAVQKELLRGHPVLPDFLSVRDPSNQDAVGALCGQVDIGEAEAIVLATEVRADFLLIDEKLGRAVAVQQGVRVVGLLGVLGVARQRGLIDSLHETIEQLQRVARFRVSDAVKQAIYKQFGEDRDPE